MEKKLLYGGFIIFIMIFSIFGFVLSYHQGSQEQSYEYGDYTFRADHLGYHTTINDEQYRFFFLPDDVEFITLDEQAKTLLSQPVIAITLDPADPLAPAAADAQYYLELQSNKVIERGITNATDTTLPEITCADATPARPVLQFVLANESGISAQDNCLIVNALDETDLYRQSDRILYEFLGVI